MNHQTLFLLAMLCPTVTGIGILSNQLHAQKVSIESLQRDKDQLLKLREENSRLKMLRVDPDEVRQLRHETEPLLKLRNLYHKLSEAEAEPGALQKKELTKKLLAEREQILSEAQQIQNVSEQAACFKNLEQIVLCKKQWASQHSAERGLPVTMDDLLVFFPGGFAPM